MAEEKTEHESNSEESHDLEASEMPEHEEAHGHDETHGHDEADGSHESHEQASHEPESAAVAKRPRSRKVGRRVRRYDVPIDAGEGGGSQTILRVKPLGFWKMFLAVMFGFFTALLLFLVTAVLAVIILGNVLWNTVETRVGNWVTDIANRVSDELNTADQSVQNIANTVEQTVTNITGEGSSSGNTSTTTAASGAATSSAATGNTTTTAASSSDSG